jgi:hypothetical protein
MLMRPADHVHQHHFACFSPAEQRDLAEAQRRHDAEAARARDELAAEYVRRFTQHCGALAAQCAAAAPGDALPLGTARPTDVALSGEDAQAEVEPQLGRFWAAVPQQLTPAEQARELYADTSMLVEDPVAELEVRRLAPDARCNKMQHTTCW